MRLKTCTQCGHAFQPKHARDTRCALHQLAPSPTTTARDAEYRANREIVLAGNPRCHWCEAPATSADHLIPVAAGGSNKLENLVPACEPCNKSRGARPGPPPRTGRHDESVAVSPPAPRRAPARRAMIR